MAIINIAEPDVTLTDYGLALECAVFAVLLYRLRGSAGSARTWFTVFFAALSAAALAGGTVHGFLYDEASLAHQVAWNATLIAIGVVALSAWMIGSRFELVRRAGPLVRGTGIALFIAYCLTVLTVRNTFDVAIIHYLPAVFFLLVAFSASYLRSRKQYWLTGLIGLSLTLVAAGVQQLGIALHPVYFDHNALYHLIQAVAVLMLFVSARTIVPQGAEK
ncbi:MAG TPA: hypothetical protein VLS27_20000 [Gammaproteobacteria bacterium]|nr:hypothetical protein [Gammaproteobacteria bacterium]